jgi:hypothetical protein
VIPTATRTLLLESLCVAVPLHIADVSTWDERARQLEGSRFVDILTQHADDMQFGGKHCARAFNALAAGLAILAHRAGGITFAGLHWCVGSGHSGVAFTGPYWCDAELERERATP